MVPEIDTCLNADAYRARRQRFQQVRVWEENLVDEIDIFDALRE